MLQNIKEATSIKLEGATEDVELCLRDGEKIYPQVKGVFDSDDYSLVIEKLKAALRTLSVASKQPDAKALVYVTNSPNPFKDVRTMAAFGGGYVTLKYTD